MSETLDHFQATNQAIVNLAAMSLSAAPGLTEAERANRFQTVARATMEFQPADPSQTILASLILGHHLTIMDGFRDIACLTLTPAEAARARMVTVAQTKLVPLLLRELRIERKDALTRVAGDHTPEPAADAADEAPLTNYLSACTEALSTLENTDALPPAAAARAPEAASQAVSPALFATPGETYPVPGLVTGNRAQRRAMMKRNGGFKRAD
jgi:hypothetical protein